MRNGDTRAAGARCRTMAGRLARYALAAAMAAAALTVLATDPPHDPTVLTNGCQDCHVAHVAAGKSLTRTDCLSCHNSPGRYPVVWSAVDQANMTAGTGSSHSWSASATNAAAGAAPPSDPGMAAKVGANGGAISCQTCHDPHSQADAPLDPTAPQTAGQAKRHFQRNPNNQNQMCLDCHSAWAQSTANARTYNGTARSHPVRWQDTAKTTDLTMANAGAGGGADWTYRQTPYDSSIKATVAGYTGGSTITLDATLYKLAPNALQGWVVRFVDGAFKNVQVTIASHTANVLTLSVTLPTIAAATTNVEIDRVGAAAPYDVTTTMAATANTITDTSRNWMTTGNASPTTGAGTVTILSTTAASQADVGKTCTISSNTATALTLAAGCLNVTPVAGTTWSYRINWKLDATGTTTAAGTTTTFVDSTKTLFATGSIVGMQVRFKTGNAVARITGWNATTFTGTFSPARGTAVAASEDYTLEPAQVGVFTGTASAAGTTTSVSVAGTPWTGVNLVNLLVRFTKAANAANQDVVTRITANTASSLTMVALPAAVSANDTFEIDLDGNTTNNYALGGAMPGYQTGTILCGSCHGVHYADSSAATYDSKPGGGDSHLLRRAATATNDELCNGCHDTAMHNSVSLGSSKYDTWGTSFTCLTCHQPHNTNNVYLVKPQITRPGDGTNVNVDFRDSASGQNPNAFVNATNNTVLQTSGNGPCEACHLNTRNGSLYAPSVSPLGSGNVTVSGTTVTCSGTCNFNTLVTAAGWEFRMTGDPDTSWTRVSSATATTMTLAVAYPTTVTTAATYQIANPRFRSATAQRQSLGSGRGVNSGDHYTTQCTGCHQHSQAFKAGESSGGVACGGCHSQIYQAMNGTTAKNFKHTLPTSGGDAVADTGFDWTTATTLSGVALTSRSCISMCHGDHPHDLPGTSSTHEYNAYLDATTSTTRSGASGTQSLTNRDNTDFDSAATNGGMCASCHQKPVVTGGITIAKATYAASAHNYTNFSTYGQWQYTQHDNGVFLRNCTKCHADRNDARPNDTSFPFGAVHFSDYDSLLAGVNNPATTQGTLDTAKRATSVCYNCHGNGTIGTNLSGKDVATQADKANVAGQSGHPTDKDAVHNTLTEMTSTAFPNPGFTGTSRHVNCIDCHDPHAAGNTLRNYAAVATATRNQIPAGSPLLSASGIQYGTVAGAGKSYPALPAAGQWPASTSANYGASLVASATYEYEVCFKCHTAFAFGGTSAVTTQNGPSGLAETDLGMEFSPTMKSGHPVVQPLNSYTGSATPKPLTAAQLTATWAAVGTQTMTCTDCHYGDAASPAVQGPHGSAVTFMLRGPNTRWPTNASNALYNLGSNPTNNTFLAGLFCLNCHPLFTGTSNSQANWANNTVHYNHSGPQVASVECVRCHILIPHGGKAARLIGDREAMPTRYAYQGTLTNMYISSFTKASTPGGYNTGNCNANAVSACNTHNSTGQTDNW